MAENIEGFPTVYIRALKGRYERIGRESFRLELQFLGYGPDDADAVVELCEMPQDLFGFDEWRSLSDIAARQFPMTAE